MSKSLLIKIETEQAPRPVGPYSQGIVTNQGASLFFVSGQLPMDPKTGKLIEGDMKVLTTQVIDNIEAILKAAGTSLDKVVKTEVFLKDIEKDFVSMNAIYKERFTSSPQPARQTVQVSELPLRSPIEISCIAVL